MAPWRTIQFFMDPETGVINEVTWRAETEGHDELTCTCDLNTDWVSEDDPPCPHMDYVIDHMGSPGIVVSMEQGALDEIEERGLDAADPEVFRDLLLRWGKIVVL